MSDAKGSFDVIVVGAGLVGLAALVRLQQTRPVRVALIDRTFPTTNTFLEDARPLSLNRASQSIFEGLGVWDALKASAIPLDHIQVSEQGACRTLRFCAEDYAVDAMGYVVPYAHLHRALWESVSAYPEVTCFQSIDDLVTERTGDTVRLTVKTSTGSQALSAPLVCACDGTASTVRGQLGFDVSRESLSQVATVLSARVPDPELARVAHQRFVKDGIMAVLPAGESRVRVVVLRDQGMLSLDEWQTYCRESLPASLSGITDVVHQATFPVSQLCVGSQVQPGVVLLGNAAHTLLPFAAQGFNLAVRDAMMLVDVLEEAGDEACQWGSLSVLQRYEALRLADQKRLERFTRWVPWLFSTRLPGAALCRHFGLAFVEDCSPLKKSIASMLMGYAGRPSRLMGLEIGLTA